MSTLSPPVPFTDRSSGLAGFRATFSPGTGDAATAERLCAIGTAAHLVRGENLPMDARENQLVWIAAGSAKLVVPRAPHAPGCQILAFHFAGDLVSVLRPGVRYAEGEYQLVALSDCDLVVVPSHAFLGAGDGDAAVLRSVLTSALQALHYSRTGMMQMGHKFASARIADFLVSMAERLADCSHGACVFALPMSRRDIGDSLGLTIETVSRQLTELREAGLIKTEGRSKIWLNDVSSLARLAGRLDCQSQLTVAK